MKKSTAITRFVFFEGLLVTISIFLLYLCCLAFEYLLIQISITDNETYHNQIGWSDEASEHHNEMIANRNRFADKHPFVKWIQNNNDNLLSLILRDIILIEILFLLTKLVITAFKYFMIFKRKYQKKYSKKTNSSK